MNAHHTESNKRIVAVIVNYNSGDWLLSCVQSLKLSTLLMDIYIVDNASQDSSMAKVEAENFENVFIIKNNNNVGFATANNQVLETKDADYYVLINPDCQIESDALKQVIDVLEHDKNMACASGLILNDDGSVQKTSRRRFPTPMSSLSRILQLGRWFKKAPLDFDYGDTPYQTEVENCEAISGAFMVVSAPAMAKVGTLDGAYFMHCEDLDWCKRFSLAGYSIASVSTARITHGKGVSSKSRPVHVMWYMHKGMMRYFQKFHKNDTHFLYRYLIYCGILSRFAAKVVQIYCVRILK